MELISKVIVETGGEIYNSINYKDKDGNWFNKTSREDIQFSTEMKDGDLISKEAICPEYEGYRVCLDTDGKYVKTLPQTLLGTRYKLMR